METNTAVQQHQPPAIAGQAQLLDKLKTTPANDIVSLDFVKKKFVDNYNATNSNKIGELVFARQMVAYKQLISASDQLQKCDPFSLYACLMTAAVNDWSVAPEDNEAYIVPRGGKAYIQPQAPAKVKRIIRSGQAISFDQAKIVFKGDLFEVENGRVIRHVERFESDEMIAGYVRVVQDENGADRYFIYRKMDWEAWRKASQQGNGANWNWQGSNQPHPSFLRTKIILHACSEKCWSSSKTDPSVENYGVVIETDDDPPVQQPNAAIAPAPTATAPVSDVAKAAMIAAAATDDEPATPVTFTDNHSEGF